MLCYFGVDIGMNSLICLVLYDVWYEIVNFICFDELVIVLY